MSIKDAHVGLNLGAIAVATGIAAIVLGTFKPHWFWILLPVVCLSLWFVAALLISEPKRRDFLAGTLKHPRYTQIYTYLTKSGVNRIWNSVCDPADDKASWPILFRAALTGRLYDKALLFAVAYPILLLVVQWVVTGDEARLGSFQVLPQSDFWPPRVAIVSVLLLMTATRIAQLLMAASQRPGLRMVADLLPLIALTIGCIGGVLVAGAVAPTVAGTLVGAVAGTLAAAIGVTGAFAVAFIFALAGANAMEDTIELAGTIVFVGVVAVAVSSAVKFSDRRGRPALARLLVTMTIIIAVLVLVRILDWTTIPEDRRSLFLFLGVLPLLNALFDVASYAVTLSLVRRGLNSRWPFLWGLADLFIACALFLGLGFALVVVVHGLNVLAGVPFIDLASLFAGIYNTPEKYVWLYLMLFSTIVPTALHGVVSLIGLQGIWWKSWRKWLAGLVSDAPESLPNSVLASGVLGVVWAIPVMGIVLLGWLVLRLGEPAIHYMLELYFNALLWGAAIPIGAI